MQLKDVFELQNGKYRIIRVLGQGGFGITYLAQHTTLDKLVAIKEFFPKNFCARNVSSDEVIVNTNNIELVEKLKKRFLKEAKNIAKLDHPGIVRILDIFEENNTAYYVMDYIEGENLNEIVKRNGPLSEEKAINYIIKVGEALDYIHSKKMTHFDVKPANIIIKYDNDTPILIDFGFSKQYNSLDETTSTLLVGVSRGYSPIELYSSESIGSFSPQMDVYSLAATMTFILTGKIPPASTCLIERRDLNFLTGVSSELKNMIEKAMKLNREQRTSNIKEMLGVINNISKSKKQSNGNSLITNYKSIPRNYFYSEIVSIVVLSVTVIICLISMNHKDSIISDVSLSLKKTQSKVLNLKKVLEEKDTIIQKQHTNIEIHDKIINSLQSFQDVFVGKVSISNDQNERGTDIKNIHTKSIILNIQALNLTDIKEPIITKVYGYPTDKNTKDINILTYDDIPPNYDGNLKLSPFTRLSVWPLGRYCIKIYNEKGKCIRYDEFSILN